MIELKWVTSDIAEALHEQVIARFGGAQGIRDKGLVEGALASPMNKHAYKASEDVFALAATLCRSIVKSHGFVDGNKRSGIVSAVAFMALNGYDFMPSEEEVAPMIENLAASKVDEADLAAWFEASAIPLP